MDGRKEEMTDGRKEGRTDGRKEGWMDGGKDGQKEGRKKGRTNDMIGFKKSKQVNRNSYISTIQHYSDRGIDQDFIIAADAVVRFRRPTLLHIVAVLMLAVYDFIRSMIFWTRPKSNFELCSFDGYEIINYVHLADFLIEFK
ncbi:hypothetical protein CEXT_584281 [Caerostris extrusa]|uniref:Uncharacterized protein n=1 Tax=Caerostris extrusa TaxID=172846 RepID=A0AAV4RPW3_CAEEX|nr:hypothetical protein CEXT_584281 [Caerostris extrusa]